MLGLGLLVAAFTMSACGAEWDPESQNYELKSGSETTSPTAAESETLNVNIQFDNGKIAAITTLADGLQVHHECSGWNEAWCEGADGSCTGCKTFRQCSSVTVQLAAPCRENVRIGGYGHS